MSAGKNGFFIKASAPAACGAPATALSTVDDIITTATLGTFALDPRTGVGAVEPRHVVVEKHQAEIAAAQLVERGDALRGLVHVQREAAGQQDLAHDAAHGAGNRPRAERGVGIFARMQISTSLRASPALAGLGSTPSNVGDALPPRGADAKTRGAGLGRARGLDHGGLVGVGSRAASRRRYRRRRGERILRGGRRVRGPKSTGMMPAPRPRAKVLDAGAAADQQHAERNKVAAHGPPPSASGESPVSRGVLMLPLINLDGQFQFTE